jgi:uncharacterized SAM-binding protein YcdF (DUF218 family)
MNTVLFVISKLVGALIRPESWLILGMSLGLLALLRGYLRSARIVLGITFGATLLLAIFPFGELLLRPLESRYAANPLLEEVDGIVVLGGAADRPKSDVWGQPQLLEAADRYTAAVELAQRFPKARVVFTGGGSRLGFLSGESLAESGVAQAFFLGQGLDAGRLQLEGSSRNTNENAIYSLAVAQPRAGQTWVLVTSAFHMPRALHAFEKAGWPPLVPWPVDYRSGRFADGIGWNLAKNLDLLNIAVKEYAGLVVSGAHGLGRGLPLWERPGGVTLQP